MKRTLSLVAIIACVVALDAAQLWANSLAPYAWFEWVLLALMNVVVLAYFVSGRKKGKSDVGEN